MVSYKKSRTLKPRGLKKQAGYDRKYKGLYPLPMWKSAQAKKVAKRWDPRARGLSIAQRDNRWVARLDRIRPNRHTLTTAEKKWLSPYRHDAGVRREVRRNKARAQKKWARNRASFSMPQHMRALRNRGHTKY